MRKILTLIVLIGLATMTYTSQSQDKLSPSGRFLLLSKTKKEVGNFIQSSKEIIGGLIKIKNSSVESELLKLGVKINTKAGNVWSVRLPVDKLELVSKITDVEYIQLDEPMTMHLNLAKPSIGVDSVIAGKGFRSGGYSGKGVVVGIVDAGFDYTHPAFFDSTAMTLNIKRVWEQKKTGNPPDGFSYGNELTTTEAILNAQYDTDVTSHGSHVAGISAGTGNGSNKLYRGIAPEADLVFVGIMPDSTEWLSETMSSFVDGFAYIFKYAQSAGKPAVANLSWGSPLGPRDGSSLLNQACNNLCGKGRIIVESAGNSGSEKNHFSHVFSNKDSVVKAIIGFAESIGEKRSWLEAWGEVGNDFELSVLLFDTLTNAFVDSSIFYSTKDKVTETFFLGSNSKLCSVVLTATTELLNKKPHILALFDNHTDYIPVIACKSKNGLVHIWNYYVKGHSGHACEFLSHGYDWATEGDFAYSYGDSQAADSIITVGAYVSKVSWEDYKKEKLSYGGYATMNNYAPFTSHGPLVDGRMFPTISAPGMIIGSAFNSFDTTTCDTNSSYMLSRFKNNGKYYSYGLMMGTSMSSPVVTGTIALMLEANPNLSVAEIKNLLKVTAKKDSFVKDTNLWGYGKLRATTIFRYLEGTIDNVDNSIPETNSSMIYPNPTSDGQFYVSLKNDDNITVNAYDLLGNRVEVTVSENNDGDLTCRIQNAQHGIYFVRITDGHDSYYHKVLIKD